MMDENRTYARLSRIQAPTLYTCGAFDESTPAANEDFARLTPQAEVEVFPDASHTAFLERRGPYIAALRAFFARVVPDAARPGGGGA